MATIILPDLQNKVDDLETNLYIVAGVLGGICGLLVITVIVLAIMIAKVSSKCNSLKRNQVQPMVQPLENNNPPPMRANLHRPKSIPASVPQSPMPYQLTAENLMNMELKNELHNRYRDSDWDNDVRSAPAGGNKYAAPNNQRFNFEPNNDRPFPLSQRPGNPGSFTTNMQNVGY